MTKLLWLVPVICVAYAVLGAVVCVLVNRDDKPAGMPAVVHAACRALRRRLTAARHTHRNTHRRTA